MKKLFHTNKALALVLLFVFASSIAIQTYEAYEAQAFAGAPVVDSGLIATEETNWFVKLFNDVKDFAIQQQQLIKEALSAAYNAVTSSATSLLVKKEYILDPLANLAAQTIIRAMTQQIIGWIQNPDAGFIKNFDQTLRKEVDAAGGEFLNQITGLNLCGNIGAFINISLRTPGLRQRLQCTVTNIVKNVQNFYRNFAQGGWPAFIKISLEPQNNAAGAYLIAFDAKIEAESRARGRIEKGVNSPANMGFLGFRVPVEKDCIISSGSGGEIAEGEGGPQGPQDSRKEEEIVEGEGGPQGPQDSRRGETGKKICRTEYETKTPGSLIAAGLKDAVYSGLDSAKLADEINEAIAAIVTALLNKVIAASSGSGGGIIGGNFSNLPDPNSQTSGIFSFLTSKLDDAIARVQKAQILLAKQISNQSPEAPPPPPPPPPPDCPNCPPAPPPSSGSKELLLTRFGKLNEVLSKLVDLRKKFLASVNSTTSVNLDDELNSLLPEVETAIQDATGTTAVSGGTSDNSLENTIIFAANAKSLGLGAISYIDKQTATSTSAGSLPPLKAALQTELNKLDELVAEIKIIEACSGNGCSSKISVTLKILQQIMVISVKVLEIFKL